MATIDGKLKEILMKFHSNPREAVWDCHGKWIAYHAALEEIARNAKITFDPPQVLEANGPAKCAAICVTGRINGSAVEWSIGEAAPSNNKNSYPFAMAEKRAKDRVILKLIGLHGMVYSEEEADDFREGNKVKPELSGPAPEMPTYAAAAQRIKFAIIAAPTERDVDAIIKVQGKELETIKAASQATYEHLMECAKTRKADIVSERTAA